MISAKRVCLPFLGTIIGSAVFCALCEPFRAYGVMKVGACVYIASSLAAVPVGLVLVATEWRKPERALGWPLGLLLATVPLLLIIGVGVVLFRNTPD
jgi:hypothetical protein